MKYNPFKPNGMLPVGAFVGRIPELKAVENSYFQTKHGNSQHFFITGERGIGKSSLQLVNEGVARGGITTFDEQKFKFLTVSADLAGAKSIEDIISIIGRALRRTISRQQPIKDKAEGVWNFLQKWEVLGVRYHDEDHVADSEQLIDELVDQVSELCTSLKNDIDGVVLLLDEIDRPPAEADLGRFLKSFDERLFRSGCQNVCFGLAGLPVGLMKMRESHPSSPRLLEVLTMAPLEHDERISVIDRALEEANEKNEVKTTITDEAKRTISEMSEGYPHFLQEFGHSAFAHDTDDEIDQRDVLFGAYDENGALEQLGDKYFNEMFHMKINSDDYRVVLQAMADHRDNWVSRKDIIEESGIKEASVTNALRALKDREIILSDEARRGYYRLPTKSFAAWIKALESKDKK